MSDTHVEITNERYKELSESEDKLDALEAMGVDNWCGYDGAMAYLRGDEE